MIDAGVRRRPIGGADAVKTSVLDRPDEFLAGRTALDDVTLVVLQRLA